jgi:GTP diphosphokinase / guanosine-3',5'-bis(diphosphate) 3'-diphosphatase
MDVSVKYKKHFDTDSLIKKIESYLPDFDKKHFKKAIKFAAEAHKTQMRKDKKTPYVVHPLSTMEILADLHAPEEMLLAGLLHDVPEDTEHTIKEVKKLFGEKVSFLVDGVTKLSKVHYQHNMPGRQVESLKKLFLHSAEDPAAILIKLADRLHNMRTLQHVQPQKRLRIAGETLEIFVPIANLLGIQHLKCQLEDLCFKYLFPTEYSELKKRLKKENDKNSKQLKKFIKTLKSSFKEIGIKAEVTERTQNLYTIYKKLSARGKTMEGIIGRNTIKIIVETIPECYEALGIVHGKFIPKVGKFKDYIANPKVNKYQSLHTMVFGVDGMLGEVQIRTRKMQLESMYGIASNFFNDDKTDDNINKDDRSAWVGKIVDLDKNGNSSNDFIEDLKVDIFQDRIFVFTPRGGKIDLPRGASAIDFAYGIHSKVGNHAVKAEINNNEMPITSALKNGDVVNIVTDKNSTPSLSWLSFTKTSLAKIKIQNSLKKSDRKNKICIGRTILQKEFDIAELGLFKNVNFKKVRDELTNRFKRAFKSFDDLFVAIGEGDVKAADVAKLLTAKKKQNFSGIRVDVKVLATNRFGLLRDISEIFYRYSSDIISLKGWSAHKNRDAAFYVKIVVKDIADIGHIFDELEQIEDVKEVYRVPYGKLYLVYTISVLAGAVWFFHPLMLKYVEPKSLWTHIVSYAGVLSLLVMAIFVTRLIKNHIPYARSKKMIWALVFGIPILGIGTLFLELWFLGIQRDWLPIMIELVIIYFYLVKSFWELKKYS